MNWNEDNYHKMVSQKLSDALDNLNRCEKDYKQALAVYQVIELQLKEYKKLIGGVTNDSATLE